MSQLFSNFSRRPIILRVRTDDTTILFGNINRIYPTSNKSKVNILHDIAEINNSSIIAAPESNMNEEILDAEIQISNYYKSRANRKGRKRGGAAVHLRSEFQCKRQVL